MELKLFKCSHCGNVVELIDDKGAVVSCCGEPMKELKAGVVDAAAEKHVPVYTVEDKLVHVVVGEVEHPMLDKHYIEWIIVKTTQGVLRKNLTPDQKPSADFKLCDGEEVLEVLAYCNLHGLWKS